MVYIILAFISGILVLLSMIVNSSIAKKVGVFQGTFINFLLGVVCAALLVFIVNRDIDIIDKSFAGFPFWAYLGGFMGVIVVAISNIIIPKIPTIYSTLLIFIGQLFTGIVLDYFTGNEVSKGKIIGGILILAGMTYNSMVDRKQVEVKEG
ncbi:EamA-like transporter family protein [Clostridium bovifaecis]|uniref:EamA-like transporter family protein n=1 Tax=Clostridium bovifaecis TaxID=2184719 RepID=A0A6I6EW41_9CLOT|nr:EamA-like transporter family protein [Clostridium bovifaecis]